MAKQYHAKLAQRDSKPRTEHKKKLPPITNGKLIKPKPSFDELVERIQTCTKQRKFGEAVLAFNKLDSFGYNIPNSAFVAIVNTCVRAGQIGRAKSMITKCLRYRPDVDDRTISALYSCLLKAYSNDFRSAYECLRGYSYGAYDPVEWLAAGTGSKNTKRIGSIDMNSRMINHILRGASQSGHAMEAYAIFNAFSSTVDCISISIMSEILVNAGLSDCALADYRRFRPKVFTEIQVTTLVENLISMSAECRTLLSLVQVYPELRDRVTNILDILDESTANVPNDDSNALFSRHKIEWMRKDLQEINEIQDAGLGDSPFTINMAPDKPVANLPYELWSVRAMPDFVQRVYSIEKVKSYQFDVDCSYDQFVESLIQKDYSIAAEEASELFRKFHSHLDGTLNIEFGAGHGDWIAKTAATDEEIYVVNELRWSRLFKIQKKCNGMRNVIVCGGDARTLLAMLPPTVHNFYVHYPEPSMVAEDTYLNASFVNNCMEKTTEGGRFVLLTDNIKFAQWFSAFVVKKLVSNSDGSIRSERSHKQWNYSILDSNSGDFAVSYFGSMWTRTKSEVYLLSVVKTTEN